MITLKKDISAYELGLLIKDQNELISDMRLKLDNLERWTLSEKQVLEEKVRKTELAVVKAKEVAKRKQILPSIWDWITDKADDFFRAEVFGVGVLVIVVISFLWFMVSFGNSQTKEREKLMATQAGCVEYLRKVNKLDTHYCTKVCDTNGVCLDNAWREMEKD